MRSNSLAQPRKREVQKFSGTQKTIQGPNPESRRSSLQQRTNITNKLRETGLVRPRKCPNCTKAFSAEQYANHTKHCFRYREETPVIKVQPKIRQESFRIKKVKGTRQEIIEVRKKAEIPVLNASLSVIEKGEVEKQVSPNKQEQFQFQGLEKRMGEKTEEVLRDEMGNQISNVEDIEGIKDAIEEEETGVIKSRPVPEVANRDRNRSMDSNSSVSQVQVLNPIVQNVHTNPQGRPRVPARITTRPPTPVVRRIQPIQLQPQQPVEDVVAPSTVETGLTSILDGININEMMALISRIGYLRENPLIVERVNNLRTFVTALNLMLHTGSVTQDQTNTVRNVLEFFVGEITHIMTIIMSARMGMMIYMMPNEDQAPIPQGFTDKQIETKFPVRIHNSNNQTCTVCLNDFQKEESTITLQCHHEFHITCISQWLKNRVNCPVCRAQQV